MLKFIGFQNLKDVVKPRGGNFGTEGAHMHRVYVCSCVSHHYVNEVDGYFRAEVFVQTIDPGDTDIIRYWCMFMGKIATEEGKPVKPDEHATLNRRCAAAVAALTEHYTGRSYIVDEGMIDAPADLRRMRAGPSGLVWNPDTETFTIDTE